MTWMTIAWPMAIGACLTMGLIQVRVGLRRTPGTAHLLFALNAFVVAAYACLELALTRVDNPAHYLAVLRWMDIVGGGAVTLSLAAFVWTFFGTGRKWLALLIPSVMGLALIPDLLPVPKLVFLKITGVRTLSTFGGATYPVADGERNPWNAVFYLGVLLLLVFVVDAAVTLWRRGQSRRAAVVGGTITFFILFAGVHSALVDAGIVRTPYMFSFAYLAILVAMGLELSNDVLNAAKLASDLRESEQRMALAVDAANLGVWVRDLVRNEIWATDQWRALLGFGKSERIDHEAFLEKLHPEDRERVRQAQAKAVGGAGQYQVEYRVPLPDGGMRWIASRGRVEFNGAGKPIVLRGVLLDVSERKRTELELERQRSAVAHLSRVTTVGEISGSLAHELNQPLGAILANTEAAEMHLQKPKPDLDEVRAILADIRKDDLRAGEIIHGMRAFLRRRDLEMQPLALAQLLDEVVRMVSADAATRKVSIGLEIPLDLPRAMGDRVHLQQVLINLVVNGMDAMSICPVALRRLVIRVKRREPGQLEVAVCDAGVGIPPGDLSRVFEPFHTTKPGGLGLGLPICRSILEAHGGSITIENNPDRGATTRFTLNVFKEETNP